ncbi:hypothetical protein [Methanosarcina sp. 1.H.A.2.2]|uniref:hypothetical protein n=1 Tax=Methanosarcina sp. 1.H.A.2.2 TaxID=1483601 RepID=UPI000621FEE6|nr:hypothetical protein [Methanosarcina sp. 1.H.A.2.2]KKH45355.1 hypothetical protein EO93_18100 [Methanosarcina sp. 1.H.A.2.2]
MEIEYILSGILVILLIIVPIGLLRHYTLKIYNNAYTFSDFAKWMFSCLLLFFLYLAGEPSLTLESIIEISLGYIGLLLAFVILFFLLRIEERGFDYKYIKGIFLSFIIYLFLETLYFSNATHSSFLKSFSSSFYIISLFLFFAYSLKILYNFFEKKENIRYPLILFTLLANLFLVGTIKIGFYESLNLLLLLIAMILTVGFVFYMNWLEIWIKPNSNEKSITSMGSSNYFISSIFSKISEYENKFLNKQIPIEKSEYCLYDEVIDAILNSKKLDLKNYNLKQLQFMLVCVNQRIDILLQELSTSQSYTFTGIALIVAPFVIYYNSFSNYFVYSPISEPITLPNLENLLSKTLHFGIITRAYIGLILMYIVFTLFTVFFSLGNPSSRTNVWIQKHKRINMLYGFIPVLFALFMVKNWLQSSEIDTRMVESGFILLAGLGCCKSGSIIKRFCERRLDNAYRLVIDINHKIIFSEEKPRQYLKDE